MALRFKFDVGRINGSGYATRIDARGNMNSAWTHFHWTRVEVIAGSDDQFDVGVQCHLDSERMEISDQAAYRSIVLTRNGELGCYASSAPST
ncbi:MAG: hypothetical protein ACR2NZ_17760 [Rubripirellula sp.]